MQKTQYKLQERVPHNLMQVQEGSAKDCVRFKHQKKMGDFSSGLKKSAGENRAKDEETKNKKFSSKNFRTSVHGTTPRSDSTKHPAGKKNSMNRVQELELQNQELRSQMVMIKEELSNIYIENLQLQKQLLEKTQSEKFQPQSQSIVKDPTINTELRKNSNTERNYVPQNIHTDFERALFLNGQKTRATDDQFLDDCELQIARLRQKVDELTKLRPVGVLAQGPSEREEIKDRIIMKLEDELISVKLELQQSKMHNQKISQDHGPKYNYR